MLKMRPVMMFAGNILLILLSWIFYKFPHGDEYLVLFVTPLIFILAPYVLTLTSAGFLLSLNLIFFAFYCFIGALNVIDAVVLTLLLAVSFGISYLVKVLLGSFVSYQRRNLTKVQKEYNDIVSNLENIERRGRGTA